MASVAILFAILVAHLLTRSIVGPLALAVDVAERVAEGDLRNAVEVNSRDEVGRLMASLAQMNANLHQLISGIRASIDGVSLASSEIASGNLDLSARTEQQASSVEETAAATEEIVSTIQRNADNAAEATKTVARASEVASKSGLAVSRVVETMKAINVSSKRIRPQEKMALLANAHTRGHLVAAAPARSGEDRQQRCPTAGRPKPAKASDRPPLGDSRHGAQRGSASPLWPYNPYHHR